MRKLILPITLAFCFAAQASFAQLLPNKTPIAIAHPELEVPTKTIYVSPLDKEKLIDEIKSYDPNGTMLAKVVPTSVSFPQDGTLVKNADGSFVWRVKIHMPKSLGIGLYFDTYQLPQGVEMFVYNENKKHIKGTYSSLENLEDKMFATDPVQGEIAYLELNIAPQVNIDEIELHVNEVASYFRGALRELYYYADEAADDYDVLAPDDNLFFKKSSACMINARCEEGSGFDNQRKSTVHTLIKSGGYVYTCSGSMINNAANDPDVQCVRYILTASHCEGSNATGAAGVFSQYIFRFNYESTTCANPTSAPVANSVTGAQFISRSNYTTAMEGDPSKIKGDFLLMKVLTPISSSWGVVLSGYKANLPTTSVTAPKKFMGFHHPAGDIKKLTVYRSLTNFSLGAAGTHWQVLAESGYSAGGSSGSALYDENGRIIGVASVAINGYMTPTECLVAADGSDASRTSRDLKYSKLSYCWNNPGDTDADNRKLKPWLDPTGTGIMQTDAVTSSCMPLSTTSVEEPISVFDAGFNIYPNPSQDGLFEMNIAITTPSHYVIDVMDITGRTVLKNTYDNLGSQIIKLDLSNVPNGIYMVRLSNEYGSTTQKVSINK